ncbi:MAG: polyisoprenoid-binding protein [Sphingobacteriales bacterium]|nr:MAG: polyisoprenoid-binding protein [Sphingobacteriales bacterium]
MIKHFFILSILFAGLTTTAQQYTPADAGSAITFKIKNLGVTVNGSFTGLKGNIVFDAAALSNSQFNVSLTAASVNTGINARDNHLRKEAYFNAPQYPQISFVSTRITGSTVAGTYFVFGKLTIKNTTKEISFPFTVMPEQSNLRLKGSFKINRRDYGVGGSSLTMSDDLTVNLDVLAQRK